MVSAIAQFAGPPGSALCHDSDSQEKRGQLVLQPVVACYPEQPIVGQPAPPPVSLR